MRILSLDGGGIRGVITAVWLSRLEDYLSAHNPDKKLGDYFDLIAGTSTGSILACGIARGIPARDIVELYRRKGERVFPSVKWYKWSAWREWFARWRRCRSWPIFPNILRPKYDGCGLDEVLKETFDTETLFSSLASPEVVVVSYDAFSGIPVIFKSSNPSFSHLKVWEVVRASCSAPTYFPAQIISFGQNQSALIDGGVVANNPSACVLIEAIKKLQAGGQVAFNPDRLFVASFGTGHVTNRVRIRQARKWGTAQWLTQLIDTLFTGSTEAVEHIVRHLVPPQKYFRIEMQIGPEFIPLDQADATHVNELQCLAREHVLNGCGRKILDDLADWLKAAGPIR